MLVVIKPRCWGPVHSVSILSQQWDVGGQPFRLPTCQTACMGTMQPQGGNASLTGGHGWAVCGEENATLGKPLHHTRAVACCIPRTLTALPSPIRSFPLTPRLHMQPVLSEYVRDSVPPPALLGLPRQLSLWTQRETGLSRHQLRVRIGILDSPTPGGLLYSDCFRESTPAARSNHGCSCRP